MSEINLNDVNSGYNLVKINNNFQELERVINEELLHKVVATPMPNSMQTPLDMNSQHIYNLPKPTGSTEPLRLKDLFGDVDDLLGGPVREEFIATAGQTVLTLSTSYVPGSNSLYVFRNGSLLSSSEYSESSTNTITLMAPATVNEVYVVVPVAVTGTGGGGSAINASNVGSGVGVFSQKTGDTLLFKTLKAGAGVTLTPGPSEVLIESPANALTASNIGALGSSVYAGKSGNDLQFKKIKAGSNVTVSETGDTITVSSSGGGGGGGSLAVLDNGVSKTASATSLNLINATVSNVGDDVTISVPAGSYLNVKDFAVTGDGVTNDSTNIQTAITAAKAVNRTLFFPDGVYVISSLGTQSGRISILGTGNSTFKGTFKHTDTYPTSADTITPLTPTSKYVTISNMNFQSISGYGLEFTTVEQSSFISTFNLSHCKFYGPNGLYCKHMIGFEMSNCEFNNVAIGSRFEGCVNGMMVQCRWQNQADTGVWITYASDHGSGGFDRAGGENLKFSNCEWGVCTYGINADSHMWLTLDSCLLDYCATPLLLQGCNWTKLEKTYLGASNAPVSKFSGVSGYRAPASSGVAVYGRPGGYTLGQRVVGVTAINCEFINYVTGSTQPIVYVDGYQSLSYPSSSDEVSFIDCLFYATTSHTAPNLLQISNTAIVRVIANRFRSYNQSTSMTNVFKTDNCFDWINHSNSFWNCTQSSVQLGSSYERPVGAIVSASDPGALGAGVIWVQP